MRTVLPVAVPTLTYLLLTLVGTDLGPGDFRLLRKGPGTTSVLPERAGVAS